MLERIEAINLCNLHITLALIGALLGVYVMALIGYYENENDDPHWVQWARRSGYAVTSISLLWTVTYMDRHQWQPWPPLIALIIGVNIMLLARAISTHIWIRQHRGKNIFPVNFGNTAGTRRLEPLEKPGASPPR